jgi:hypothetical protein
VPVHAVQLAGNGPQTQSHTPLLQTQTDHAFGVHDHQLFAEEKTHSLLVHDVGILQS